jgi:hypothetical protein
MSRLNASIKLVVMIGDTVFLLVAIIAAIIAALVMSGQIIALDFPEARRTARNVLVLTVAVLIFTIYGCCGAINQIVRKGCFCAGRRVLCFHQFLLLAVLVTSVSQQEKLANREKSIDLVIANVASYPNYDLFESRLDKYFNKAYFEGNCALNDDTYDKSSTWLMEWVDRSCPSTMSRSVCALSEEKKENCDTTCYRSIWNVGSCCPSEYSCLKLNLQEACPYNRCRVAVLNEVRIYVDPALKVLRFVTFLAITMIILTCLLICYNPRDDIEIELLKTGVMTEEDVETIKQLKSQRNFSYEKGNGKGQHTIDLDKIHQTRTHSIRNNGLTQPSRRSLRFLTHDSARVYPTENN